MYEFRNEPILNRWAKTSHQSETICRSTLNEFPEHEHGVESRQ